MVICCHSHVTNRILFKKIKFTEDIWIAYLSQEEVEQLDYRLSTYPKIEEGHFLKGIQEVIKKTDNGEILGRRNKQIGKGVWIH